MHEKICAICTIKKGKTNKKLEYIKLHKDCYLAIKCNLMIAKIQYIG
ncbi:hypothetical protein CLOBOL_06948 [Enterocloster bolteae ATCC BAA-613]|uniref:Uncharacterized protein n=1 Tax=Enterocloster bolteae (strain ATCC BAA-613 / DSM 15670 / CCUG 46953 / JCM 12243 / WAL 16351) TaxID=411902 RepID=A8S519_ENTBW|nr:hypothetical protein CLOBOL_06948 [Enterocloster bolteae ATCC BAA-613]